MPITIVEGQVNSDGFNGTTGNVTLPSGTTAGNTVAIYVTTQGTALSSFTGFTRVDPAGTSRLYVLHRLNVPAAESSWTITTPSQAVAWVVVELEGLDQDAPIDVNSSAVTTTTSGTTINNGTTSQSTTYDGNVVAIHAFQIAGTTPGTISAQTGGVTEIGQHGQAGTTNSLTVAVSMRDTQSLGAFTSTATASATMTAGLPGAAWMVVYTAAGARREPTLSYFWSFPAELAGMTSLNLGISTHRYFETQVGTPVILGGGGMQLTGAASTQNISYGPFSMAGTVRAQVGQIKFRIDSASADIELAALMPTGSHAILWYRAATGKLGLKVGSGTEQASDATITIGQDISVDIRLIGTTTAYAADWQVDYGAGPVPQTQATVTAGSAMSQYTYRLGWLAASTGQVTYWHGVYSNVAGHYPLSSNWAFPFLKPDTAGTVTARTGTTADLRRFTANGTIAGSFNSADIIAALRDWPPTLGASADGAAIVTASTGTYSIPLETYEAASNGGSVRAAMVLGAFWAMSATTATIGVSGHDGTTSTALLTEQDVNADTSTTPPWEHRLWRPSGGWTQTKMDAATVDIFSADATPDIGFHCLAMIAAVRLGEPAPMFGDLATATHDPDSAGLLSVSATPTSGYDATLHFEEGGTPTDVPAPGGATTTEVIDAPDAPSVEYVALYPPPEDISDA